MPLDPFARDVYARWIAENVPTPIDADGACEEMTTAMIDRFPELRRKSGHYDCPELGPCEHFWCATRGGAVVDPTAHQYPSAERWPGPARGRYVELGEGIYSPSAAGSPSGLERSDEIE